MQKFLLACLLAFFTSFVFAQKKEYKAAIISFYNLENLFDTVNNPLTNDEEFLPGGVRNYNTAIYYDKLDRLAKVISQIGTEISPDGPAILGVAEVENDTVMKDLASHALIAKRNYQVIHYDSRDARGIDVGLMYNPRYFKPEASGKIYVQIPGGSKDAFFTRDILWVKGRLDGEPVHVYVNHWPSRSGGEQRTAPAREAAAQACRTHIDSILAAEPGAKIIVMGDLNDDPTNASVAAVLNAKGKRKEVRSGELFNPWMDLYRKGYGTLAYQDAWGLFDQIIISENWLERQQQGFYFHQQQIFNRPWLVENRGRYKGYPMRTWDGNTYRGGYSDHFPTYLVMLKEVNPAKKAF